MKTRITLFLIILSGAVLRLAEMNKPLSHDEAYTYIAFASSTLWHAITDYSLPNNHLLHTALVYFSAEIFGIHPWSIRIPAFLAGVALIVAVYFLGKYFYSASAGLAASALTAFFPTLIHFSSAARGYSLMGLFTVLGLILGYKVLQTREKRYWLWLSLCMSLGFWTIPIMLFPAGAIYLWILLEGVFAHRPAYRSSAKFVLALFGSGFLTIFITALLYLPVVYVSGIGRLISNSFVSPLKESIWWAEFSQQISRAWAEWVGHLPEPLFYALILGFVLSLVFHPRFSRVKIPVQVAFLAWLAFLVWFRRPAGYERFWVFLLPLLFLWALAGWTELSLTIKGRKWELSGIVAGVAALSLLVFTVLSIPGMPEKWNKMSNTEGVSIFLAENMRPGEIVLSQSNSPAIWFHLKENGMDESYWQMRPHFEAAYVIVSEGYGESIETVIKANRMESAIDPNRLTYVFRYGRMLIYYYLP